MKAVFLTEYGNDRACLTIGNTPNVERQELQGFEVLVRVKACGLGSLDLAVQHGIMSPLNRPLPTILGYELVGVVQSIGPEAKRLEVGQIVAGVVPVDYNGACCDYTIVPEFSLVPIISPGAERVRAIQPEVFASVLLGGLRAYTALHYKCKIVQGDSVLILDGASASQYLAIQLAGLWGCTVFTTCRSDEEKLLLTQSAFPFLARIIDLRSENILQILAETGNLGVDCVIEDEPLFISNTNEPDFPYSQSDILRCLAVHGCWVTSRSIQLDPPETLLLTRKSASVSFLMEQTWLLSTSQEGRYLHIITDLLKKVQEGDLKPSIAQCFPMQKFGDLYSILSKRHTGRLVVKMS